MSNNQNPNYSNDDDEEYENDTNVEVIELTHGHTEEGNLKKSDRLQNNLNSYQKINSKRRFSQWNG